MNEVSRISVLSPGAPYSTDPLEYDFLAHHFSFRSVYSSLVTQYKSGEILGIIAKNWKSENGFKDWSFVFRSNATFETGERILPEHVAKSWLRIIDKGAREGRVESPLDQLVGINKYIKSRNIKDLKGLAYSDNDLKLTFTQSQEKLLQKLSFGIFSVVHPSSFDLKGKWINQKKIISSSFYKINKWDKDSLILEKRNDFLEGISHPRNFKYVEVYWEKGDLGEIDLYYGSDLNSLKQSKFNFTGGVKSGITYIRVHSHDDIGSSLYSKDVRESLRDALYSELNYRNIDHVKSFFPLAIDGVVEHHAPPNEVKKNAIEYTVSFYYPGFNGEKYDQSLIESLNSIGKKYNFNFVKKEIDSESFWAEAEGKVSKRSVDLAILSTSILVEDPRDDINFMFKSKRGICLPDVKKRIIPYLENQKFSIQRVNEMLWEDGAIWPIVHKSNGLYYKDHVDLSLLNVMIPPVDFAYVGY